MDYTIRHITRFRYSAPIAESIVTTPPAKAGGFSGYVCS
jgi:hypothetical protein